MHDIADSFVREILVKHGVTGVEVYKLVVKKQYNRIDVLVEVNDDIIILIEDKVGANPSGDQLSRYDARITAEFPKKKVLLTYIKTYDQSDYCAVKDKGYKLFLREDMLRVLERGSYVENDILNDFHRHIRDKDDAIKAYASLPVADWGGDQWIGFFKELKKDSIKTGDWGYVPNPSGGFNKFCWNFSETINDCYSFLQIEQSKAVARLCFKIGFDKAQDSYKELRSSWHDLIMRNSGELSGTVRKPDRFGSGQTMTFAVVKQGDWMVTTGDGIVDLTSTSKNLIRNEDLLSRVCKLRAENAAGSGAQGIGTPPPIGSNI